jgi:hypothetical protein
MIAHLWCLVLAWVAISGPFGFRLNDLVVDYRAPGAFISFINSASTHTNCTIGAK